VVQVSNWVVVLLWAAALVSVMVSDQVAVVPLGREVDSKVKSA
jgi:hypothetical protein